MPQYILVYSVYWYKMLMSYMGRIASKYCAAVSSSQIKLKLKKSSAGLIRRAMRKSVVSRQAFQPLCQRAICSWNSSRLKLSNFYTRGFYRPYTHQFMYIYNILAVKQINEVRKKKIVGNSIKKRLIKYAPATFLVNHTNNCWYKYKK